MFTGRVTVCYVHLLTQFFVVFFLIYSVDILAPVERRGVEPGADRLELRLQGPRLLHARLATERRRRLALRVHLRQGQL